MGNLNHLNAEFESLLEHLELILLLIILLLFLYFYATYANRMSLHSLVLVLIMDSY